MRKKILIPLLLLLGFSLFACMEKEGGDDTYFENAPVNPDKAKLVKLINEVRAEGRSCGSKTFSPAQAVVWNDTLATVARKHSEDMANNDKLSHTGTDGTFVDERITREGYVWRNYAENLLKGGATEDDAVQAWLESPSHCENLMDPTITEIGVGTKGAYWTLVMASH